MLYHQSDTNTYTRYQFLFSSFTVRCGLLQIGDVIRNQLQDHFEPIQKSFKSQKKKGYLPVSFGLYGSRVQYNTTTTATATAVPST